MRNGDVLLLKGRDIQGLLYDREAELVETVRQAYLVHARAESSLPHSSFLNFPNEQRNRIIALPAFLGHDFDVAGIKWIASFPNNVEHGMDRASAVVILNSAHTGAPLAILEGSIVSAKRTAASAALAARTLHQAPVENGAGCAGIIGCGLINFEIVRFLRASLTSARRFVIFDLSNERAQAFKNRCLNTFNDISIDLASNISSVLSRCSLISLATTAVKPHLDDLSLCAPGTTILHISLRDITPEAVLRCDNVVDDVDHVCRAQTSVHLAEQMTSGRDFIRCTLSDVLLEQAPPRRDTNSILLFSPFGLGVLDLAVSQLVYKLALDQGRGLLIDSFLPGPWAGNTPA
jgi:2,3-diaminopropionate biosynthesis protein SbnB